MDDALELADCPGPRSARRRRRSAASCAVSALPMPSRFPAALRQRRIPESAQITFDSTGGVAVSMGTHSHGRGHEISFAQIVADFLGLETSDVNVRYGDTDMIEFGVGTFGSRSIITGSNSLRISADRLIERGKKIRRRAFRGAMPATSFSRPATSPIAGTDRSVAIKDVAKMSYTLRDPSLNREFGFSEKVIAAPKAATLSQWLPRLRSRDRSGYRRVQGRQLCRGRRCRPRGESDAGQGPGAWRRGAGRWPDPVREHRL